LRPTGATHILTGYQDVAIIPNSVIAKSKLVNCSAPNKIHGASIHVRLEPSLTPAAGCNLLMEVLLSSSHVLRVPEPSVTVKDNALAPLLKARPAIAEELSETLASLQLANRTVLHHHDQKDQHEGGLADRVAANIRRLFSLH
jgi:hypothetical protein